MDAGRFTLEIEKKCFIEPHKTPSYGRGQRSLALPVNCPSATPRLEMSPQFKLKGAADEQVSEAISRTMTLSISHCMGKLLTVV